MARRSGPWRPRRVIGAFRFSEDHPGDPGKEVQRLVVYLPASMLEEAERQSIRLGGKSVKDYCETILLRELETEKHRGRVQRMEVQRGRLEGLHAVSNDPDYLAELSGSRALTVRVAETPAPPRPARAEQPPIQVSPVDARSIVLRHAGLESSQSDLGFLATLRRGETLDAEAARELLQALVDLERANEGSDRLDRRLAYALNKLALEGQVLITEGWTATVVDSASIAVLRRVQEAVERVLSGEDIRYESAGGDSSNPRSSGF